MAGYRPPYTMAEDQQILRYIIDGEHGGMTKGDNLWKQMEEEEIVPNRTWQSLKNRWTKHVLFNFTRPEYGLKESDIISLKEEIGIKRTPVPALQIKIKKSSKLPPVKQEVSEEPSGKEKEFNSLDMNWSDSDTE